MPFCRYGFSNISRGRSEHVAARLGAGTEAFARAGEHDRPGTIVGERRFERRPRSASSCSVIALYCSGLFNVRIATDPRRSDQTVDIFAPSTFLN
jgi:hypothetical protein